MERDFFACLRDALCSPLLLLSLSTAAHAGPRWLECDCKQIRTRFQHHADLSAVLLVRIVPPFPPHLIIAVPDLGVRRGWAFALEALRSLRLDVTMTVNSLIFTAHSNTWTASRKQRRAAARAGQHDTSTAEAPASPVDPCAGPAGSPFLTGVIVLDHPVESTTFMCALRHGSLPDFQSLAALVKKKMLHSARQLGAV
jgi:hypothetical protein